MASISQGLWQLTPPSSRTTEGSISASLRAISPLRGVAHILSSGSVLRKENRQEARSTTDLLHLFTDFHRFSKVQVLEGPWQDQHPGCDAKFPWAPHALTPAWKPRCDQSQQWIRERCDFCCKDFQTVWFSNDFTWYDNNLDVRKDRIPEHPYLLDSFLIFFEDIFLICLLNPMVLYIWRFPPINMDLGKALLHGPSYHPHTGELMQELLRQLRCQFFGKEKTSKRWKSQYAWRMFCLPHLCDGQRQAF